MGLLQRISVMISQLNPSDRVPNHESEIAVRGNMDHEPEKESEINSNGGKPPHAPGGYSIALKSKPVLVVDDGEANRRLIELVLGRAGAVASSVENGLEAIKALSENDYALIFMDMQMPVLDGYSATRRIRSAGLKTAIVALTGSNTKENREKCLDAGCDDFLAKPVNIDELLHLAARFIGQDSAPTQAAGDSGDDRPTIPVKAHAGATDDATPIHSALPMDDEAFRGIVIDFIGRLETRLDGISEAIGSADFDAVASDAHWLKGAGGTVGFPALTEPARRLEQAAKESDADAAERLLQTIVDIHRRMVVAADGGQDDVETTGGVGASASTAPAVPETGGEVDSAIHCALPPEFSHIVSKFLIRLDERIKRMKQLCVARDFEQLADEAHWLKGSGGTVGYHELTQPATDLNEAARRRSLADVKEHLKRIISIRQRMVPPVESNSAGEATGSRW